MISDLELIQNITALGLIALFLIVMKPLIKVLAQKLSDKLNGTNGYSRLEERINKIEGNHLEDVYRRLDNLERDTREMRDEIEEIKIRLVKIETRLNGRN